MEAILVAPCGMNCALCSAYLAQKNDLRQKGVRKSYCVGCRPRGKNCAFLKKSCALLGEGRVQFCFECGDFPCDHLKHLDKRYSARYHMSMIDNLNFIKEHGMEKFLKQQAKKWQCPDCDAVICCHDGICYNCQTNDLIHFNRARVRRWVGD